MGKKFEGESFPVHKGNNEMETVVVMSTEQCTVLYCTVRSSFFIDDMTELHRKKNCTGGPVW